MKMNTKKDIIITLKYIALSIIPISVLFYLKNFLINKKKLIKIIAKLLTSPIHKKDKKLINELLDLIIKIYNIKELNVITENDEYYRSKNINKNIYNDISEDIKYKNKIIGFLKISFIK